MKRIKQVKDDSNKTKDDSNTTKDNLHVDAKLEEDAMHETLI